MEVRSIEAFTNLFHHVKIGMLIFSQKGSLLHINQPARDIFKINNNNLHSCDFETIFGSNISRQIQTWYAKSSLHDPQEKNPDFKLKINTNTHLGEVLFNIIDTGNSTPDILCQLTNFTMSLMAVEEIIIESHYLLQLINNIPDNIFIKDSQSRFLLANIWVSKIMGVSHPIELIGKTDFEFHPKKLAQKYYNDEQEIIASGQPKLNIVEKVIEGKNNLRWYSTSKLPLKDNQGNIIGIMGIGRDISQSVKEKKSLRKAKHTAEKANQLKTAFLANLSHEIRTPLNGIIGFSQFLQNTQLTRDKQEKYLNIITDNGKHLLDLINDIIDVSKIDSEQLRLYKKNFILSDLLIQLKYITADMLKQSGKELVKVNLEIDLSDNESTIFADDIRLKQILFNLLSNAVKFTHAGSISFGCKVDKKWLKFFVKDSGIGISSESIKIIFERFRQEDNSLTRQYAGAGLGLSIVHGLVKLLGGDIEVFSDVCEGSEFTFRIPYVKSRKNFSDDSIF